MRVRALVFAALVAGLLALFPSGASAVDEPYVTLTPPWGPPGTVVSINAFNFRPNEDIKAILRVTGDPVIATGRTDEYGHANLIFTFPSASDGLYNILVTDLENDCDAGTRFQVRPATPTVPPTVTPVPPTVTPVPPTAVPPTPQPPIAGGGQGSGTFGSGLDALAIVLALVIFGGGFTLVGLARRNQPLAVTVATPMREALPPVRDEIDINPATASATRRERSDLMWIAGGLGVAATSIMLLVRGKRR
jgi:hypothetical protein